MIRLDRPHEGLESLTGPVLGKLSCNQGRWKDRSKRRYSEGRPGLRVAPEYNPSNLEWNGKI